MTDEITTALDDVIRCAKACGVPNAEEKVIAANKDLSIINPKETGE